MFLLSQHPAPDDSALYRPAAAATAAVKRRSRLAAELAEF